MTKLPPRDIIFSQTLTQAPPEQSTFLNTYNRYRETISNRSEALNRVRVLSRQLQKSRSNLRTKRRDK